MKRFIGGLIAIVALPIAAIMLLGLAALSLAKSAEQWILTE